MAPKTDTARYEQIVRLAEEQKHALGYLSYGKIARQVVPRCTAWMVQNALKQADFESPPPPDPAVYTIQSDLPDKFGCHLGTIRRVVRENPIPWIMYRPEGDTGLGAKYFR